MEGGNALTSLPSFTIVRSILLAIALSLHRGSSMEHVTTLAPRERSEL